MKKIYEDVRKFFESRFMFKVLCVVGILALVFLVFYAGVTVGFHKASFGRAWGENYERNFGFGPGRMMFNRDNFPNANGAAGKILKITLPTIIVQGRDGTEKVISISNDTRIEEMMSQVTANALQVGGFVVVIGSPNSQGQIDAKFIRIMPFGTINTSPATQTPTSTK